jgi:hypothetical protein
MIEPDGRPGSGNLARDRGADDPGATDDVREFLRVEGPFVTIALPTPSDVEDAAQQLEIRWHNARAHLRRAGVADEELARLEDSLTAEHHGDGAAVVLIQAPGAPTFVEFLDAELQDPLVTFDTLPRLGPVLEHRQRSVPHLMVVADRTGADIIGIGAGSEPTRVEVEGETLHIHRGHPGGWSQRRFQQRAENRWESNARANASEVADLARRLGARVITIAGDVRAVAFLREHLPKDVADLAHELDSQSPEGIAEETVRAIADIVARDTLALLEEFRASASQDRAVAGAEATLAALTDGRVGTLLIHDDPGDGRRAGFDPAGTAAGTSASDGFRDGRLVDVAIRSALLGGGEVRFVPKHAAPDEGIGALVRWGLPG